MATDKKFLVMSCGTRNKKVVVQEKWTLKLISEVFKERFDIDNPSLQFLDHDVDEWIDLEESCFEDIENYKILKLRCNTAEFHEREIINPTPPPPLDHSVTLPSMQPPNSEQGSEPTIPPKDYVPQKASKADVHESVPSKRKPWPRIYKLPTAALPRSIVMKLNQESTLDKSDRRQLLDCIYNDVTSYDGGLYPTPGMYESMVDCLLQDYPYLLRQSGLSPQSNRVFWKDKLVYKFGNSRKRIDQNLPEVIERRKKPKKAIVVPPTGTQLVWGLKNYLPPMPASEDATSLDLHVKWLQREHKKTDQDVSQADLLMGITFPHRRHMVIEENVSTATLLDTYPWLASHRQLLMEFQRLGPNTQVTKLDDLLGIGLKKYRTAVLECIRKRKLPTYLVEMIEVQSKYHIIDQRNYAQDCIALLGLPAMFKEKSEKILSINGRTIPDMEPMYIIVQKKILTMEDDMFSLMFEGQLILKTESFLNVFSSLIGFIYALNLAYPKSWEKTLMFIQTVILGLKDTETQVHNKKIIGVLSELNATIQN